MQSLKNQFFHGNGFNWVQIAEFNQLCVNWVDCLIDGIAISHSIGEIKCKKQTFDSYQNCAHHNIILKSLSGILEIDWAIGCFVFPNCKQYFFTLIEKSNDFI